VLEPSSTPGAWQWNVGTWLSYAQSPVVLRDATGQAVYKPVLHSLGCDLVAGLGIGDRAAIGIDVPLLLWQNGSTGLPAAVAASGAVPTSSVGDVSLHAKASILDNNRAGVVAGVGVAALATLSLPTGDRASFEGEGSVTASLRVQGEYAFAVGAVRATVGYASRTVNRTWPDASVGGVSFGDQLPWSVGMVVRPGALAPSLDRDGRQLWELGVHGSLPAGPVAPFGLGDPGASALSPALLAADDRVALGHYRDGFVLLGAEVGLDRAVGVPGVRGVVAVGWAPRAHDRDHDGIADDRDECPDLAEDRDGIQDEDGCPEDDADSDGVLDSQDACPLLPGVWWNDRRRNGCPAPDSDGDGIPDPVDACPAVRGERSADARRNGCPPASQDRDNDGIPDDADKCPDDAEDRDGNDDFDGCPDPDDDGDGIVDTEDACPKEKGSASPDPARNGCPAQPAEKR
jgi:OmpA-OmpF porin, OOP family